MDKDKNSPITIIPKFAFGVRGDLKNSLFFLDDQRIIYAWGHNVVILNIGDDKTQEYIPCIEGSEGITAMAVSHMKTYLAVWERADKAIWSIYIISSKKRRKILTTDNITDREFISVAFSQQNEKGHLVTLTGGQDGMVILWQWNKGRWVAFQKVGISEDQTLYQASFISSDSNSIIVIGNGVYKYYKLKDNGIRPEHSGVLKKETHISSNYTCHTWLPDGKIIICTDQGEMLYFESTGEYKMMLNWSPCDGFYIETIINYSNGIMIAGDSGQIMVFSKTDEPKKPFILVATWPNVDIKEEKKYPALLLSIMAWRIKNIALSSSDDTLVFTTENNQLMRVNVNLEKKISETSIKYEYLVYPFHSRAIHGLDTWMKKPLVATCSVDKTIRIWNFSSTPKLEICESFQDEVYWVAFHPSGYHIVAGFTDKVRMMNVFSEKKLSTFKEIPIKSCREIQFSNGGHLFAWVNSHVIQIYNFYTGENPHNMTFQGHDGKVRCISWFEDDSGFISAGWDGKINVWNIKNNLRPEYYFEWKGTNFSWVFKMQNSQSLYAVGTDKAIREISYKAKEEKSDSAGSTIIASDNKEIKYPLESKENVRYESFINYSQVALLNGGRGIILGTADDDLPGMVQIYRFGMEKAADIQLHSLPVERIKLTFDNNMLFSVGQDGSFFLLELRDTMMKREKEAPSVQYFAEILTEKSELRELQQTIEHLKRENEQLLQHKALEQKRLEDASNEKISKLIEERDDNKHKAELRRKQLEQDIHDMQRRYNEEIIHKERSNQEEIDRRKRDFEEKKEQDKLRYQELYQKMDEEGHRFEQQFRELELQHREALDKLEEDNRKEIDKVKDTAKKFSEEIKIAEINNKKIRDELESECWSQIDMLKEKNKTQLYNITKQGMDAKAELTLTTEKYNKSKTEKEGYEQTIKEKQDNLNAEIQKQQTLKSEIENQINEIAERKRTIADKETRIFQLKKKTQELEKFKFVLDYKIKELKRDINPKEAEIGRLKEQTSKMQQELDHFQRVNQNLSLIVDDLRMRESGLEKEIKDQDVRLEVQEKYIKKFCDDLYDSMKWINNYKELKSTIIGLHKTYVLEETRKDKGEKDLQKEYAENRRHLEKSVNYLRIMITKDSTYHRQQYTNYMRNNVVLLQEVNDLRKEVKTLQLENKLNLSRQDSILKDEVSQRNGSKQGKRDFKSKSIEKELKLQDLKIQELTDELAKLQEDNEKLNNRPQISRGGRRLQPIEKKSNEGTI